MEPCLHGGKRRIEDIQQKARRVECQETITQGATSEPPSFPSLVSFFFSASIFHCPGQSETSNWSLSLPCIKKQKISIYFISHFAISVIMSSLALYQQQRRHASLGPSSSHQVETVSPPTTLPNKLHLFDCPL